MGRARHEYTRRNVRLAVLQDGGDSYLQREHWLNQQRGPDLDKHSNVF